MAAKSVAFKEAPPIRPPSTCLLGEQLVGVGRVHRAAVLDGERLGRLLAIKCRRRTAADHGADLLGLVGGRGFAGADGPDGLIGDDDAGELGARSPPQRRPWSAWRQTSSVIPCSRCSSSFAHAEDDGAGPASSAARTRLIDGLVGLAEVLAALAVADDDVLHTHLGEHGRRRSRR